MAGSVKDIRRRFKSQFDRNYDFLREIASEGETREDYHKLRRTVQYATDAQLDVLLDCIHFVLNGKVCLRKEHYNEVLKSPKRLYVQEKLENLKDFCHLRSGHRKGKIDLLIYMGKLLFPFVQSYFTDCTKSVGSGSESEDKVEDGSCTEPKAEEKEEEEEEEEQ